VSIDRPARSYGGAVILLLRCINRLVEHRGDGGCPSYARELECTQPASLQFITIEQSL